MAAALWHLDRDGVEYGPFDWNGLQTLAKAGRLRPTDLVRQDGLPFWLPAGEAREDGGVAAGAGRPAAPSRPEPTPVAAVAPAPVVDRPAVEQPPPTSGAEPGDAPDFPAADEVRGLTATSSGRPRSHGSNRNSTGPAVLALVLAVGGLFWFGLLLGGVAVALAAGALRGGDRPGDTSAAPTGRRLALAALLLGMADVAVMTVTLVVRLHGALSAGPH